MPLYLPHNNCTPYPHLHTIRSVDNVRGSVGVPTPGTRLLVVDPDTHAPLPDGQQGLILAAGPGVMAGGYAGDAAATAGAFVDGWFNTGVCFSLSECAYVCVIE